MCTNGKSLSPVSGTENLNAILQDVLNKSTLSLRRGGVRFCLGDKVMQIRNNYDKGVHNGDIGIISNVDLEDRSISVNIDGRVIKYDLTETDELVLAYATTIHKAQGSEFPIVVMPLAMSHYIMLQRNLLYTGITRAKRLMVIVGSKKAVYAAVRNNKVIERNTHLKERLSGR